MHKYNIRVHSTLCTHTHLHAHTHIYIYTQYTDLYFTHVHKSIQAQMKLHENMLVSMYAYSLFQYTQGVYTQKYMTESHTVLQQ